MLGLKESKLSEPSFIEQRNARVASFVEAHRDFAFTDVPSSSVSRRASNELKSARNYVLRAVRTSFEGVDHPGKNSDCSAWVIYDLYREADTRFRTAITNASHRSHQARVMLEASRVLAVGAERLFRSHPELARALAVLGRDYDKGDIREGTWERFLGPAELAGALRD